MRKIKEVLRFDQMGLGQREIGRCCSIGQESLLSLLSPTGILKTFSACALWPTRPVTAATPRFLRAPRNCSAT